MDLDKERWISVKDMLPPRGKKVRVTLYDLEEETAELWHNAWIFSDDVLSRHEKLSNLKEIRDMDVTHWKQIHMTKEVTQCSEQKQCPTIQDSL